MHREARIAGTARAYRIDLSRTTRYIVEPITGRRCPPGMRYPLGDRAVNLSALRRAATKKRNLSSIIIFIRICDSSRVADIYFETVTPTTPRLFGSTLLACFLFFSLPPRQSTAEPRKRFEKTTFNIEGE